LFRLRAQVRLPGEYGNSHNLLISHMDLESDKSEMHIRHLQKNEMKLGVSSRLIK